MPPNILGEDPHLRISGRLPFPFLRTLGGKACRNSHESSSFHCKGISMEDKFMTNQFSQIRPRKSNDKNRDFGKFLMRFKMLPISIGTEQLHFETRIKVFLRFKTHPSGQHLHVAVHVHKEVTTAFITCLTLFYR